MMKYLDKIKVMAETSANGQECTEMVFSKEPGYYSLIIVSDQHSNLIRCRKEWLTHYCSAIFKCRLRTAMTPAVMFVPGS